MAATDMFASLVAAFALLGLAGSKAPADAEATRELEQRQAQAAALGLQCAELDRRLPALQERLDELDAEILELDAARSVDGVASAEQLETLRARSTTLGAQRDALRGELARREQEVAAGAAAENLPRYELASEVKQEFLLLVENGVVPFDQEHFKVKRGYIERNGARVAASEYKRCKDGEDVATAFADAGCLGSLLADFDPSKQCLSFLVCADSIDALGAIAARLRERKLPWTWDTAQDASFIATSGPSTSVPIHR